MSLHGFYSVMALSGLLALTQVGCSDTKDQIAAMEKRLQEQRQSAAAALADRLINDPNLEQAGDVQLFVSAKVMAQALTLFDGLVIPVENIPGLTITVKSVRPEFTEGIAALLLDFEAKKGDLVVEVLGTAALIPEPLPAASVVVLSKAQAIKLFDLKVDIPKIEVPIPLSYKPVRPLRFNVQVMDLAPKVSWGPFSTNIEEFVSDFAKLKINDYLSQKLPAIEAPWENSISILQPAQTKPTPLFSGKMTADVIMPPVAWSTSFSLSEVVALPRGLHLIGSISNSGAVK